jgi:hypothetical protein
MRIGTQSRFLSDPEKALAILVFGPSLPPWDRILIDDGLGMGNRCYTLDGPPRFYLIHIGPIGYPDCTSKTIIPHQGPTDTVFIHEMTHVWQYAKGDNVKLSSLWGQATEDDAYDYLTGAAWNDYNSEQQASIVEKWYAGGMAKSMPEFQYVEKVVRKRGVPNASLTLVELRALM